MAGIAGVSQVGIGLGECRVVLGLNRAVELLERVPCNRGDHFGKGDVVFNWMSVPEPTECAAEISELVGGKFPIFILLGAPESLVPRLNRRDHQIADARQIFGGMSRRWHLWLSGRTA